MADKVQTHSIIARFAETMSSPLLNAARPTGNYGDEGQLKTLTETLAERAWLKDTNGAINADRVISSWDIDNETIAQFQAQGVTVEKRLPLKQLADLEMIRRQGVWDTYKVAKNSDPGTPDKPSHAAIVLQVWEKMYLEKGKIIAPKYLVVTGNRRSSVFFDAMVKRFSLIVPVGEDCPDGSKGDGKKTYGIAGIDDTLPVVIDDYSGNKFRLEAQLRENEMKKKGFLPGSPIDQYRSAIKMMEYGASQSRLRETFGSPTIGVKLYYMRVLDMRYKNLHITERVQLKPENPDSIPLNMVSHNILQGMGQRFDQESTNEYNGKKTTKGGPFPVLTEREVDNYFRVEMKKGRVVSKIMDKTAIETIKSTSSNPVIRTVAEAIYNNETKTFEPLLRMSEGFDALILLEAEGDYPNVEKVIKTLAVTPKGPQRTALENKLLAVIAPVPEKAKK